MRALNYVEGQSYVLDAQYTAGKNELLPEQVSALVRARADVIVAGPAPALLAAKQMTTTIPLVMTLGADPVSFGVATVSTPTFLDPEEAYFCSAVLHSAVDCANCPSRMGGDFSMLHNPGAINSIGPETFSWCEQFFVRGNEVCREGPIEGRM